MTIAELKEALEGLPDDTQVVISGNQSVFYSYVTVYPAYYVGDDAPVSRGEVEANLRHEREGGFEERVLVLEGGW